VASVSNGQSIVKSPILIFSSLLAISVVLWWSALGSLFALALHDEQYTHILLILPISSAFILLEWKSPASRTNSSLITGSVLLLAALLTRFLATGLVSADLQLSLNIVALVAGWIGSFILCFGSSAFRDALFPLFFLLWLVPLPQFVLNSIVTLLQKGSAASAYVFLRVTGFAVEQRGTLLHLPGLTLDVAPECSSIRSSMMLLVTTMVLAQILLLSFWRKAVTFAAAIPLSVLKNGLRIFVLGVLTTKVDPRFFTGRLHRQGGIIYFLVALLGILWLLWILRRSEKDHVAHPRE
jgi:exosortase